MSVRVDKILSASLVQEQENIGIHSLPNEMILHIFSFLPGKPLIDRKTNRVIKYNLNHFFQIRRVCIEWNENFKDIAIAKMILRNLNFTISKNYKVILGHCLTNNLDRHYSDAINNIEKLKKCSSYGSIMAKVALCDEHLKNQKELDFIAKLLISSWPLENFREYSKFKLELADHFKSEFERTHDVLFDYLHSFHEHSGKIPSRKIIISNCPTATTDIAVATSRVCAVRAYHLICTKDTENAERYIDRGGKYANLHCLAILALKSQGKVKSKIYKIMRQSLLVKFRKKPEDFYLQAMLYNKGIFFGEKKFIPASRAHFNFYIKMALKAATEDQKDLLKGLAAFRDWENHPTNINKKDIAKTLLLNAEKYNCEESIRGFCCFLLSKLEPDVPAHLERGDHYNNLECRALAMDRFLNKILNDPKKVRSFIDEYKENEIKGVFLQGPHMHFSVGEFFEKFGNLKLAINYYRNGLSRGKVQDAPQPTLFAKYDTDSVRRRYKGLICNKLAEFAKKEGDLEGQKKYTVLADRYLNNIYADMHAS